MKPTLAILFASAAAPAFAEDFQLIPPLDCGAKHQDSCIIQQYVDSDPSTGAADYTCGTLSYDGHKGTDFRVASLADLHLGIPVVAAAGGMVTATRDGMLDANPTETNRDIAKGRDCGNGLVINHGGGWETQYCHLMQGSVAVSKGDRVEAGTRLGLMGMSGRTEFPHVHLSVRKDGQTIDPFNPADTSTCNQPSEDLWAPDGRPDYLAGGILDVGFHDGLPKFQQLKQGEIAPEVLPTNAPALVLWVYMFGSQPGDTVMFDMQGPGGWSFQHETTLERQQAELFRASGKRRPAEGWQIGSYDGTVRLERDGDLMQIRRVKLQIRD